MINKRQIFNYNLSLKILARKNRNNPTKPELVFWNEILRNKFTSYKFLRQKINRRLYFRLLLFQIIISH